VNIETVLGHVLSDVEDAGRFVTVRVGDDVDLRLPLDERVHTPRHQQAIALELADGEPVRLMTYQPQTQTTGEELWHARYCACTRSDAEHDPRICEREAQAADAAWVAQFGPCPRHDYDLPFDCTCR